jgi:hypothetical protein
VNRSAGPLTVGWLGSISNVLLESLDLAVLRAQLPIQRGRVLGGPAVHAARGGDLKPALVATRGGAAAVTASSAPSSQQVEHQQPDSHQRKEDEEVPVTSIADSSAAHRALGRWGGGTCSTSSASLGWGWGRRGPAPQRPPPPPEHSRADPPPATPTAQAGYPSRLPPPASSDAPPHGSGSCPEGVDRASGGERASRARWG